MIREMREKLGREIDQLSHELNVLLPQAIAQAVELGDLRENSEYKAALERQQFVQARLGQLHQRLNQLSQLANTEAPTDRVGLGSRVTVLDLDTNDTDTYMVVLAEMMDFDAGHISLASPLGRALSNGRVGRRDQPSPTHRDAKAPHSRARHRASGRGQRHQRKRVRWSFPRSSCWSSATGCSSPPEDGDDRTRVGLYLPATAIDAQQVQTGLIVATGPGTPVADLSTLDDEPWRVDAREGKNRGMQARVGITPSSSARPRSRSRSRRRSTWSSPRRPFSS